MINLIKDIPQNSYPEVTPATDSAVSIVVPVGGGEQTVTIPGGSLFAKFTADADFYATFDNTTVAVPNDAAASGTTLSILNPGVKVIRNSAGIKINAKGLAHVTIEFFS